MSKEAAQEVGKGISSLGNNVGLAGAMGVLLLLLVKLLVNLLFLLCKKQVWLLVLV